jgi:predicted NodU family carbamoyl transferase
MAHAGFAATIQVALEEAVFQLARTVKERSGADQLIITGGVGLNCTLNGRLARVSGCPSFGRRADLASGRPPG